MHLFIDPVLLAAPVPNGDATYAKTQHDYVTCLLDWADEVHRGQRHSYFMAQGCIQALFEDDRYPDRSNLRRCLYGAGSLDPTLSPEMVFTVIDKLVSNTPYLEDYFPGRNLNDVIIAEERFTVRPDLLARLPPRTAEAMRQSLSWIAWLHHTPDERPDAAPNDPDPADLLLVTHPIGQAWTNIHAEVMDANAFNAIDDKLPLVTHPNDLLRYADMEELWHMPRAAIVKAADARSNPRLAPYGIGRDFVDSIRQYNFQNHSGWLSAIYKNIVLLLSGHTFPGGEHHTFGHPPHQRDQWIAWRLHITGPPSSIRLHYWRDGNRVLLMKVFSSGRHDDDWSMIGSPDDADEPR